MNLFNTKFFTLLLIIISFSAALPAWAVEKKVTKSDQPWVQYYNQTKLNERWIVFVDGSYRWKDWFEHSNQYLVRAAIGYNLTPNLNVAAGCAQSGYYTENKITKYELRPFQEISGSKK